MDIELNTPKNYNKYDPPHNILVVLLHLLPLEKYN